MFGWFAYIAIQDGRRSFEFHIVQNCEDARLVMAFP